MRLELIVSTWQILVILIFVFVFVFVFTFLFFHFFLFLCLYWNPWHSVTHISQVGITVAPSLVYKPIEGWKYVF